MQHAMYVAMTTPIGIMAVLAVTSTAPDVAAPPDNLSEILRDGGYVLFIRHPKTNPDQADTDPLHLENVQAQRQLSEEGRQQAKALGEAFRTSKLPVGKVIASKFHRAQEAADLMELGKVIPS